MALGQGPWDFANFFLIFPVEKDKRRLDRRYKPSTAIQCSTFHYVQH